MAAANKIAMRIFFSGTSAITFIIIVATGYMIYVCVMSDNWPTIPGRVTQSELSHSQSVSQNDTGARVSEIYQVRIAYTYHVNGHDYNSTRFALFSPLVATTPFQARERLSLYPVGAAIPVHYNPQKPEIAVLETGWRGTAKRFVAAGMLVGLYFLALGSHYISHARKARKRAKATRKVRT